MDLLHELIFSETEEVLKLNICVVLKDLRKHRHLSYCSSARDKLGQRCKHVLLNRTITVDPVITLTDSKLARAYGICHIIVHEYETSRATNPDSGLITNNTEVNVKAYQSEDFYDYKASTSQVKFGGYESELKQLSRLLLYNKSQINICHRPKGVLLHGPPGCGKSSLVKHLAHTCDAIFINVEGTDLLRSEHGSGSKSLADKFKKAKHLSTEGPVILFLDEIDALCPKTENASLGNRQLTSSLVSEMDRLHEDNVCGLLILAATNSISSVNPALRRPGRFDQEVLINVPTKDQRVSILRILTSDLCLSEDARLDEVATWTVGYVGADLQALTEEAASRTLSSCEQEHNVEIEPVIRLSHFKQALHTVSPSLRKNSDCVVEFCPVRWEDIGGLDDVKIEIQQSIEWPLLYPETLCRMDLSPTKGMLLYGPPGCCKTTLVRAAATSCHVTFLSLNGAQVYSPYVGESERIISEAFQKARALSPAILFFDEIESLVGKRTSGAGQSRVQERILSTMLNEMDGVGTRLDTKMEARIDSSEGDNQRMSDDRVSLDENPRNDNKAREIGNSHIIVIGATNRPDMLDSAILRPGRLDKLIAVPAPDLKGREAILQIQTSKMSTNGINLYELSETTQSFSGADLKNLCKEAGLLALRERLKEVNKNTSLCVQHNHFLKALETVKPSLIHV